MIFLPPTPTPLLHTVNAPESTLTPLGQLDQAWVFGQVLLTPETRNVVIHKDPINPLSG